MKARENEIKKPKGWCDQWPAIDWASTIYRSFGTAPEQIKKIGRRESSFVMDLTLTRKDEERRDASVG